jgi:hypothetical protein
LKEEALDRTVWITRFGSSYGEVVRHSTWRWSIVHRNEFVNIEDICIRKLVYECTQTGRMNVASLRMGWIDQHRWRPNKSGQLVPSCCLWWFRRYVLFSFTTDEQSIFFMWR